MSRTRIWSIPWTGSALSASVFKPEYNPVADTEYSEKEMSVVWPQLGPKSPVMILVYFDKSVPGAGSRSGGSGSGQAGGWQGFWRNPGRLHTGVRRNILYVQFLVFGLAEFRWDSAVPRSCPVSLRSCGFHPGKGKKRASQCSSQKSQP